MATVSLLTLCQSIADIVVCRLPTGSGTVTSGTSTTVVAANHPFRTSNANANAKKWVGDELYITSSDWTGTPNPNDITTYAPSTGTLTVGNTYAADTPAAADTFDIYTRGVSIREIRTAINEALRNAYFRTTVPLTYVTDGDMESSGITNLWTASASATVSKVTNTNAIRQAQSLRVLATAATQYAQSNTIVVDNTYAQAWYVQARVRADVGTARLIAYDVTNSANIDTVDWTLRGWGIAHLYFSLPSTCEALAFRLESLANADDTYWEEVIAFPIGAEEFPAPSFITTRDQMLKAWQTPTALFRADWNRRTEIRFNPQPDPSNPNTQWRVRVEATDMPIWLEASRQYSALSADTDTTFMDRELLTLMGAERLLSKLAKRPASEDVTAWKAQLVDVRRQVRQKIGWAYTRDVNLNFAEPT